MLRAQQLIHSHWTLDTEDVRHYLGSAASMRSWALAISAGVLSLGPVYPRYALLGELHTRGMHSALIAALLHARAIKLPWLPLMAHYFGLA